jgi:hypothetical protein
MAATPRRVAITLRMTIGRVGSRLPMTVTLVGLTSLTKIRRAAGRARWLPLRKLVNTAVARLVMATACLGLPERAVNANADRGCEALEKRASAR